VSGEAAQLARIVAGHKRAHVAFLKNAIGLKAGAKPTFDFKGTTEIRRSSWPRRASSRTRASPRTTAGGPNLTKPMLAAAASIVPTDPILEPTYGPLAFGTSARSATLTDWPAGGFVGIHGTNQPSLIPGRISHGCIRLRNADILRLDRLMSPETPLWIVR